MPRPARPPAWRLIPLLVVLVLVAGYAWLHRTTAPPRATVALRGHTAPIGAATAGSTWPEAMHDASHSGTAPVRGPQTGHVRWTRHLGANATPGPVLTAAGLVLQATNDGVIHALSSATGADVWTWSGGIASGTDLSTSPAVLPSGVVVWGPPGNALVGLSSKGSRLWSFTLHGQATSPAVVPGGVIVGDTGGWVTAVTVPPVGAATVRWSVHAGGSSYGSVAVTGSTVYQTVDDGLVAIIDGGATATIAWHHALPSPVEVSPAATPDGGVVTGAGGDKEYGLDRNGRVRWTHDRKAETYSSPVVTSDGLALWGDHRGIVTVVDAVTGKLQGRYAGLGHRQYSRTIGIWSSPVVDRSHDVYFASYQGHVMGFSPSGRRLFDLDTGTAIDSYPALTADGGLVVGDTAGTVRYLAP